MGRSILDRLPAELAFMAPAVRQMLAVHDDYRSPVDPRKEPERARDAEIAACFEQDFKILTDALRKNIDSGDRQAFVTRVQALRRRLFEWLEPQKRRPLTSETRLLFVVVGLLANPEAFLVRARRRRKTAR